MERMVLDLQRVMAQERISRQLLVGLQHPEMLDYLDMTSDHLVMSLNAYVMTEPANGLVTDTIRVKLPVRPGWMPKFLWRRIPLAEGRWTLSVQTKYTYPQANMKVPDLGPVIFMVGESRNWEI